MLEICRRKGRVALRGGAAFGLAPIRLRPRLRARLAHRATFRLSRFEQTMFLFLQRLHEPNDRGDSLLHSRITDGRVFLILLLEIIAPERHPEAFVRSLHIAAIDVSIDLLERELPAVSPAKLRDVRRIRFGEVSSFSGAGCSVAGCAKSIEVMLTRGLALSGRVETGYHKTEHNGDEDRSEHVFWGWIHRILTLSYGPVYTSLVSLPA